MSSPAPRRADRARVTSRAAVLAAVVCAIALSLAYPVREYIAQRRQIDQLQAERQVLLTHLQQLQKEQQHISDPAYIERLARDKLHLCMRGATCYVIIGGQGHRPGGTVTAATVTPWYERLWQSVHSADRSGSP